jgi:hypothetical protein
MRSIRFAALAACLAAALPGPAAAITQAQVTVASTATLIVAARPGRSRVTVMALAGTTKLCLGGSSAVTTANGFCLAAVDGASMTFLDQGAVYGIVASGTLAVAYSEEY